MNIISYINGAGPSGERLQNVIDELAVGGTAETFRATESFVQRIRYKSAGEQVVAVVLCGKKEELLKILLFRELLYETRVILILPDREKDTVAKGHLLRPRFLTYADSDFGEVAAVLNKMFDNYLSQKGGERIWKEL